MITVEVCKRKYNGETYTFYFHTPEFKGEKGCIGIELTPYVSVKTPENCFGYTDTVLQTWDGTPYTLHRYLQPWILRKIKAQMDKIKTQYTGIEIRRAK